MAFDFKFTETHLARFLPTNPHVEHWYEALADILPDYEINTKLRVAAFLGQTYVESNGYTAIRENLNYRAESLVKDWPTHFPTLDIANQYAHNQEKIANRAYADRMGNGDEASGDGWRYCGRGLIQITGHDNYKLFAESITTPLDQITDFLGTFEGAVQSACWYWETHTLNTFADTQDIKSMTKAINGGYLGLDQRIQNVYRALQIVSS